MYPVVSTGQLALSLKINLSPTFGALWRASITLTHEGHLGHNLVSARQGHRSKRHILKTSPFVDKSHFFICWTGFLQNFCNETRITLSVAAILPCITVRINMESPTPSALYCCFSHRSGGNRGKGVLNVHQLLSARKHLPVSVFTMKVMKFHNYMTRTEH